MLSDEALYRALIEGDMSAFDELYRRYEHVLFGFLVKQLRDTREAEDVFHEAFMAVLKERKKARALKSFKAWLFQVARNLVLNRARGQKRAARAFESVADTPAEPSAHPENILVAKEAPEALRRALAALPQPLSELYDLRAAGLSYEEMAVTLGVPLGTVKSRMHEMITRLKQEIRPWTAQ